MLYLLHNYLLVITPVSSGPLLGYEKIHFFFMYTRRPSLTPRCIININMCEKKLHTYILSLITGTDSHHEENIHLPMPTLRSQSVRAEFMPCPYHSPHGSTVLDRALAPLPPDPKFWFKSATFVHFVPRLRKRHLLPILNQYRSKVW